MKIAFFEIVPGEQEQMATLFDKDKFELVFSAEKLTAKTASLAADAEVVSVFINSMVGKDIIDALPQLKLITTRSAGYDHIDSAYAKSKNIAVATVPAYGPHTVAEFAFALILSLSRKIITAYNNLRSDEDFDLSPLTGFDLFGKTIGVVGTGRIGKNAVQIARGFGMNILGYDMYPDVKFAAEVGMKYVDLPTLLASSDIITLHAPYTPDSHHLINKENIKGVKKGALLINTARGELVDTDALIWALNEGILAGAGLDVLEGERFMKEEVANLVGADAIAATGIDPSKEAAGYKTILEDHTLIHNPRVIVTPHMAFDSREAKGEILKTTAENIAGFFGGTPQNLVK